MTYCSRKSWISLGLGSSSNLRSEDSESSSSMISLQRSMHSSQMYTPGPAMSFLTCFWLFPQNEHLSRSPLSPIRATWLTSTSNGTAVPLSLERAFSLPLSTPSHLASVVPAVLTGESGVRRTYPAPPTFSRSDAPGVARPVTPVSPLPRDPVGPRWNCGKRYGPRARHAHSRPAPSLVRRGVR